MIMSFLLGGGGGYGLSFRRCLFCSILLCVVDVFVLDHNPFAPAYLAKLRRAFAILWTTEEVVGVLKATGEGKVSLVALISIMSHFFFVERQHFRHFQRRLYYQGAQREINGSTSSPSVVYKQEKNNKTCWHDLASPYCLPRRHVSPLVRNETRLKRNFLNFPPGKVWQHYSKFPKVSVRIALEMKAHVE